MHPDDLDYEEQQPIKNANGGQRTVFNRIYNDEGWAEAYYDGHSTRDRSDEPDPDAAERRSARAAGNLEYEDRKRRQ